MSTIIVGIECLVGAAVARWIYLFYFHPLSRYPGPLLAHITNLWKFSAFLSGEHHLIEQKLHQRYGNVIRTGPTSLSISSLSGFEAIYGFNKVIEKGDFYDFGRDARSGGGSIFSARSEADHRVRRLKAVGPALTTAKIANYEPVISKHVSVFLSKLARAQASATAGSIINIAAIIHSFTFDTIVEVIYGESLSSQPYTSIREADNLLEAFKGMSKYAWASSMVPWLGWLMSTRPMVALTRRPTKDAKGNLVGLSAFVNRTRDVLLTQPEKTLDSSQSSIAKNYLQVPTDDSKHMLPDEMWRECFNLTFAGPGSTAAALTTILYQLGTEHGSPWQSRIRAESNSHAAVSHSALVLTAVIKETMRLNAPFSTAFPRNITHGAENAIPDLPAPLPVGTLVSANTYILGHSKDIWGDDAEEWKPERWLVTERERKELDDKFVVFSKGSRGCIGKEISMMMLTEAIVGVLSEWKIEATGDLKGKAFLEMQYSECGVSLTKVTDTGGGAEQTS
ncbi:hypothetical protein MMC26_002540 [Xylographa opegraphella]|nr:hypothetical protein [Xylographa opegraphella]